MIVRRRFEKQRVAPTRLGGTERVAPGATAMAFSPSSLTTIRATPLGASGSTTTKLVSIPSLRRFDSEASPNSSRPTLATSVTRAPSRAAATAWFAPLPPAALKKEVPRTVWPAAGRAGALTTRSVFELPTTTMRGGINCPSTT